MKKDYVTYGAFVCAARAVIPAFHTLTVFRHHSTCGRRLWTTAVKGLTTGVDYKKYTMKNISWMNNFIISRT